MGKVRSSGMVLAMAGAALVTCLLMFSAAAALLPRVANADTTIDTIPYRNNTLCCWNREGATIGQVVTVPMSDPYLNSFTFFAIVPDTNVFRGEVYAWDGEKATGPNLYESEPMRGSGSGEFEEITFETGGVSLVPNQQYILFMTMSKDYAQSDGYNSLPAMATTDPYTGGVLQYDNNGNNFNQLFTAPWDSVSMGGPRNDYAFRAVFASSGPPDTTAPETSIDSTPDNTTTDNTPSFSFSGYDDETAAADLLFSYKVDDEDWSEYSSHTSVTLGGEAGLSDGSHTFYVRAKDEAGNSDESPAESTFTVDTTPPTVTTTNPSAGSKRVNRASNITATFSEEMDPTTLNTTTNTSTVQLLEKHSYQVKKKTKKKGKKPRWGWAHRWEPMTIATNCNDTCTTVTLDPSVNLLPNTDYLAVVSTGAQDEAGNRMVQNYSWTFATGTQ